MSRERAFAASIVLDAQYIYVFGGMADFNILQSIEKYDTLTDLWETVFFELPQPLAKLGACLLDRSSIMICGGMSADFEATAECYQFYLEKGKWVQVRDMACPKLVSSGLIAS